MENYEFNMIIIKPNTPAEGRYNSFNENVYKYLDHDETTGPYSGTDVAIDKLNNILSKKDIFETMKIKFESMLFQIETFYNPNRNDGYSFQVKTCIDNENELIMFIYDGNNKDTNQYNYLASLMTPKFESIFGPVFITKILKNNNKVMKHIDITTKDITTIWLSIKQITYWDFCDSKWTKQIMFNNNKQFNEKSSDWSFIDINKSIVFYKLNQNMECDVKKYITDNLQDVDKLNTMFKTIKICKLKTGEYVNEELNYNKDLTAVQDLISSSVVNAFTDYEKYQIVMESIFQNALDTIIL